MRLSGRKQNASVGTRKVKVVNAMGETVSETSETASEMGAGTVETKTVNRNIAASQMWFILSVYL